MKKYILVFVTVILLFACSTSKDTSISNEMDYSYLALGDSYTIGEGVPTNERWPVQLVERLRERGFKVAPPKIIARTGWTTLDLIRNIEQEINVQRDFDMVSILIGVNNQYQNKPISVYEEQLREIFRKAIFHCKHMEKGVFAVSIPDYGATPFGANNAEAIGLEIDRFNAVFRSVAEEFNVPFYNITPISREAASNRELVAGDNLHPSGLMYTLWVDLIVDEVAQTLQGLPK
jgi:lysophospholipase L1-like esterase